MKKKESLFKEKVLRDLKIDYPDAYFFKTQERGRRGVLDIIGCENSKFFTLELKTDDGKLDDLQRHTIQRVRKAGGIAFETSPSDWPNKRSYLMAALA